MSLSDFLYEEQKAWVANCQYCGRFCRGRTWYDSYSGGWEDDSECATGKGCKKIASLDSLADKEAQ